MSIPYPPEEASGSFVNPIAQVDLATWQKSESLIWNVQRKFAVAFNCLGEIPRKCPANLLVKAPEATKVIKHPPYTVAARLKILELLDLPNIRDELLQAL